MTYFKFCHISDFNFNVHFLTICICFGSELVDGVDTQYESTSRFASCRGFCIQLPVWAPTFMIVCARN